MIGTPETHRVRAPFYLLLPDRSTRMAFQRIPAGRFQMGNTGGHSPERDTEPVHSVEMDAFWMGVHPVTNGQFQAFTAATGYQTMRERRPTERPFWTDFAGLGLEDYPVVAVNWLDAAAFFRRAGLRLPTEAEWEYAARGGLDSAEFPWGDEPLADQCNWRGARRRPGMIRFSELGGPTPVGSYPPNGYGLHDMAGNVWEWVADAYQADYYTRSPVHNPAGPDRDYKGLAGLTGGAPKLVFPRSATAYAVGARGKTRILVYAVANASLRAPTRATNRSSAGFAARYASTNNPLIPLRNSPLLRIRSTSVYEIPSTW